MQILLTEGSGLTSRQVAARLAADGHDVGIMTSDPRCLARFTRDVRRRHAVVRYGTDPLAWWERTVAVHREEGYDVLLPTQEQVAVLSGRAEATASLGVRTVVPPFAALAGVLDKVAAAATLERLDIPRPRTTVVVDPAELDRWQHFPVFVKAAIGTASSGVRRVVDQAELRLAVEAWGGDAAVERDGVVLQEPVDGPLLMVQTVFDHGRLVAGHANLRVTEGARGGASHKRSVLCPDAIAAVTQLGTSLDWHGALSADVVLGSDGVAVIDVNPRLVEPMNAWWSGVDLVGPMVDLALGRSPATQPLGAADVATHQLLLAVAGAAQAGRGRRAIVAELVDARRGRGDYAGSHEELRSSHRDPAAAALFAVVAGAAVVHPGSWKFFASSSVDHYALGSTAWAAIRADRGRRFAT